jgi:hypothetical protein
MIPTDLPFRCCGDYRNLAMKRRWSLDDQAEGGGGTPAVRRKVAAKANGVSYPTARDLGNAQPDRARSSRKTFIRCPVNHSCGFAVSTPKRRAKLKVAELDKGSGP